jgi:hypothetical protein
MCKSIRASKKQFKSKQTGFPKGSKVIKVAWLHAQVVVLRTNKQYQKLLQLLDAGTVEDLAPDHATDGVALTIYDSEKIPYFVMFLPTRSKRIAIHECTHMVHMLFEVHGIPLDIENTEGIAYMTDYLCEETFNIMKLN